MRRAALAIGLLLGPGPAPPAPIPMDAEQAVAEALVANPDLLDARDAADAARAGLSGVRSQFLPQVSPFYDRVASSGGAAGSTLYGVRLAQQFSFGPRLEGAISAGAPDAEPGYSSTYAIAATQPLLKGADPAVTREPLRAAERALASQERSFVLRRRQTVLTAWTALLGVVAAEELVTISEERTRRAERLLEASEAKYQAGSLSRLDALRASQLLASARSQEYEARNARNDSHDALGRVLGRPPGSRFAVVSPVALPVAVPDEETAVREALEGREDVAEERDRVRDAEVALRISRSMILPTLDAVAGWSATGRSDSIGGSLSSPGKPSYSLGFRSRADVNLGTNLAAKAQAEIGVRAERRRLQLLEDDVVRAVRQSARRLSTQRQQLRIEEGNLEVARTQLEVANLRFEKGLTDNFNVVDAENLFNSARITALFSRHAVLLGELDLLLASGLLRPEDFVAGRAR